MLLILPLDSKLLKECCRTDDLMPSISFFSLHPCSVHSEVLGLNVLMDCCPSGRSWVPSRSPPVSWSSQCSSLDPWHSDGLPLRLFELGVWRTSGRWDLTSSETGEQPAMPWTVLLWYYGIRRIFRRHQVSKASRHSAIVLRMVPVTCYCTMW